MKNKHSSSGTKGVSNSSANGTSFVEECFFSYFRKMEEIFFGRAAAAVAAVNRFDEDERRCCCRRLLSTCTWRPVQ
jgi:hypothetical protein